MNEDFEVDDILAKPPKKIKSGQKGKGAERAIVKILNARFADLLDKNQSWGQFSRSLGSGNRWGQVSNLPKHAQDTFSGDLCCPDKFRWIIESKKGYNDVDLCSLFSGKCAELDNWLNQVERDGERSGRKPMVIWQKDRKPRIVFLKQEDMFNPMPETGLCYRGWVGVSFDDVLKQNNRFWFKV